MILHGDSLERLKEFPDNYFDSVVTDPPYGLKFMGKKWDYDLPSSETWREIYRTLKPGAHLLSFGGTRTFHRLACRIEDAEFEIRDQLQWIYGSGFPKSHNLGNGWGTALKPANEPICLARKPLSETTVAKNVLRWGTGAINIDESRIGTEQIESGRAGRTECESEAFGKKLMDTPKAFSTGRWPANVLFDEAAAEMLDEQSGVSVSRAHRNRPQGNEKNSGWKNSSEGENFSSHNDSGGASRFFYCAKSSKAERNAGLEGMPERICGALDGNVDHEHGNRKIGARPDMPTAKAQNHHPTVKPIKLMEYLIKLITPPGGIVLDPFAGSGSTGVAAMRLGFGFIGIEMNEEYVTIATKRLEAAV